MARHGVRLDFFDLPTSIIDRVQSALGSPVVNAVTATGGFTRGPAARCDLADGRQVFVKACGDDLSSQATAMHRQEADVLAALPEDFPAPSILAIVDVDDWFALITEYVEGEMPKAPLADDSVVQVLDLVSGLAAHGARCDVPVASPVGTHEVERSNRWAWKKIKEEGLIERLDPWSQHHLEQLVGLEDGWIDAAAGTSLLHRDLRTDNMIIGVTRNVAVDWPVASIGAAWVDLVGLLPALHLDGGPLPSDAFDAHPVATHGEADAVNCYLAALAGYFTRQALLPAIPGVHGLREFQADQGRVARQWLTTRLGWQ